MEGLERLDVVGDISPALEATEDFIHCLDGGPDPGRGRAQNPRQTKQLPEGSSRALGKLSSSGVWGLLAGEQPEVGPRSVAWADHPPPSSAWGFSVLGLRHTKRSRARSTNDLAAHTNDQGTGPSGTGAATNAQFKKGHNRSRSDVNYRPSAYTDNGRPTVLDRNTLQNMALNHQREVVSKNSSSGTVVRQGPMEQREGPRGRWLPCHLELTPCELRLYVLDSSANRQLSTAYSLSHCQSVTAPAPLHPVGTQPHGDALPPPDPRTLQALFFNSTRLQLRAASQGEALGWRRRIWDSVLVARPADVAMTKPRADGAELTSFPTPMSPSSSTSSGLDTQPDGASDTSTPTPPKAPALLTAPARPTALPLFTKRCPDVVRAGLLHQLSEQNTWGTYTFVLTRSALQAFPTEGRGPVSVPVLRFPLSSCLAVQRDHAAAAEPSADPDLWVEPGERFQVVFPSEVLRLRAESQLKAQDWLEALQRAVAAQRPCQGQGEEGGGGPPGQQGVLLRSRPTRERRQREAQRAKRQSVTTSFLSILTCLAVEKGLTAQSFRCAGCQRPVGLSRGKAKVCDYSGWYYCQSCHHDNLFLIPARLLHNWDTSRHKVSKQAKEFLEFVYEEPLLDVQQLNPCLYEHCEPLGAVLRLRQQLQSLRAYLFSCRTAVAEDLRRRIFPREYLLQHIHLYSLSDLQQVIDGKMAPFLSKVIKFASGHVYGCSLCREKGFICEMCQNGQVIYPFQDGATKRCDGCGAVFHTSCRLRAQPCPRCVRRELQHTRPSTLWSPQDQPQDCYYQPYQDT
ncbi:pleckstrin homology domain-containing family M member 3 [Aplochiton taeniatus]